MLVTLQERGRFTCVTHIKWLLSTNGSGYMCYFFSGGRGGGAAAMMPYFIKHSNNASVTVFDEIGGEAIHM